MSTNNIKYKVRITFDNGYATTTFRNDKFNPDRQYSLLIDAITDSTQGILACKNCYNSSHIKTDLLIEATITKHWIEHKSETVISIKENE